MTGPMRLAIFLLLTAPALHAQAATTLPGDAVRIQEAFRLVAGIQDSVWPGGFGATPFPLLLVTQDREYLVAYPRTPAGFAPGELAPGFGMPVLERPRQFSPTFLATFPAFGPPSVIVVGEPEATGKPSSEWIITILHERFHQFQSRDSTYYAGVDALDLSGGDQTGMWMLNYPFPYDSASVATQFASLAHNLARLVQGSTPAERKEFWRNYLSFLGGLAERDRRYLSFQLWQEGVARYVELQAAAVAARRYHARPVFMALPDFKPFDSVAAELRAAMLGELVSPDLPKNRRVSFYAFGAGLALLLDRDAPGWQRRYLREKFALERYLPAGG